MLPSRELRVGVAWDGARVTAVQVRSTPAYAIAKLVRGRSTESAVSIVSSLHAVCSSAHRAAAATACAIARQRDADRSVLEARARLVDLEAIQEHCTRLGLHWPEAMNAPALVPFVRAVRSILSPLLHGEPPSARDAGSAMHDVARLAANVLFGMPVQRWLELQSPEDLAEWLSRDDVEPARWYTQLTREFGRVGCCAVGLMPGLDARMLESTIAPRMAEDAGFARTPDWDGRPVETGALARQQTHPLIAGALQRHGNSVATRLLARMTDLAALLTMQRTASSLHECSTDDAGCAAAFTARGLLVHRAVLSKDVVDDYAIVAPTEWNFHPHGVFAAGMAACDAHDEGALLRCARLLTEAIDPCVPCIVEVGHA